MSKPSKLKLGMKLDHHTWGEVEVKAFFKDSSGKKTLIRYWPAHGPSGDRLKLINQGELFHCEVISEHPK